MAAFDRFCAETVQGLLPPRADALHAILRGIAGADESALPMMVKLLLTRLPEAAALLMAAQPGPQGSALKAAADETVDKLLEQLVRKEGAAARIASTSLEEAGTTVRRIATLLRQLEDGSVKPARRAHLKAVRQTLDAGCRTRFAAGLRDEVLALLLAGGNPDVQVIEAAARDLRALENRGAGCRRRLRLRPDAAAGGGCGEGIAGGDRAGTDGPDPPGGDFGRLRCGAGNAGREVRRSMSELTERAQSVRAVTLIFPGLRTKLRNLITNRLQMRCIHPRMKRNLPRETM